MTTSPLQHGLHDSSSKRHEHQIPAAGAWLLDLVAGRSFHAPRQPCEFSTTKKASQALEAAKDKEPVREREEKGAKKSGSGEDCGDDWGLGRWVAESICQFSGPTQATTISRQLCSTQLYYLEEEVDHIPARTTPHCQADLCIPCTTEAVMGGALRQNGRNDQVRQRLFRVVAKLSSMKT